MVQEASTAPDDLEQLRRRFDEFRSTQASRSRLPETLWAAAAELAKRYGVNPTARALRLDYTGLRKRVENRDRSKPKKGSAPPPIVRGTAHADVGSRYELQRGSGVGTRRQAAAGAESCGDNGAGQPDSSFCRLRKQCCRSHRRCASWWRIESRRWTQGNRWVGSALPGETVGRSIFRLLICVPKPPRNVDPNPQLRRPGILAGAETALQGTLCLVAERYRASAHD